MAATTFSPRWHWIDDIGTPEAPSGNGTELNDAELQKIIDLADWVFNGADRTFGGRLHAEGFGTHLYVASGSGPNQILVRNQAAGTTNYSAFALGNNSTASAGVFMATSSSWTPTGGIPASAVALRGLMAGGLSIQATDAAGDIRFYPRAATSPTVTLDADVNVLTSLRLTKAAPVNLFMRDTAGAANQKEWLWAVGNNVMRWQTLSDDGLTTVLALELLRSGTATTAFKSYQPIEVYGAAAATFNTQLRVGFLSTGDAPAVFQSGEPGVSASNVVVGNNYYGINGGSSGRLNTAVGGAFMRLTTAGGVLFGNVSAAGAVGTTWSMGLSGPNALLLPGDVGAEIGSTGTVVNKAYIATVQTSKLAFNANTVTPLTHFDLEGDGETLDLTVDGNLIVAFGTDLTPSVWARHSAGTVIAADRTGNDGTLISLRQDGTEEGSISVSGNTVSYNAFMGSHYTQLKDGQSEQPPGTVMVATGELAGLGDGEKFPHVEASTMRGQKGVYGVWHTMLTDDPSLMVWALKDRPVYLIASLGLWYCRVTDTGGDIAIGEWLQASPLEGLAERQVEDDGITYIRELCDRTIAKAEVAVNWNTVTANARGIKELLIPVTLHAG
jgi:hypothetical protein